MPHDVSLIALVAVSFVLASVFGYAADRLRLPALVGYLVAGIFMGPFTPGFVADTALAGQLAEIGVILLMFGVGLHFSTSDLLAVRGIAIPGAVAQIVLATLLTVAVCHLWGWTLGQGILLGLCLSVASTVVLLKALEERNLVQSPMGRAAVGWLIVEDLAMVMALVLLPAFAEVLGGHMPGGDHGGGDAEPLWWTLLVTFAKVGAFVALAALIGPRLVPWVLMKVARTGSRELFTMAVLAIAMGIAFGSAAAFGVSFALGAFFAGVIMTESQLAHRAAENSLPLQDAFSVLFFVSIGMLFDPSIIMRQPLEVFGVLAIIMVGKAVITLAIVAAMGYPLKLGLGIAAGLSQIGEFSFILASLGVAYGLMDRDGQDLVLAGALLSITFNPLAFSLADKVAGWARRTLSERAGAFGGARLATLVSELDRIKARTEEREREQEHKITQFLETFPLFSSIDKDAQEELLLMFTPKSVQPGERVIRTGERGDAMYFLSSGRAEVSVKDRRFKLGPGAYFGEMALLSGGTRTADVTALDFSNLLVLSRRDFNLFMSRHPELRVAVEEMASQRAALNVAATQTAGGQPA